MDFLQNIDDQILTQELMSVEQSLQLETFQADRDTDLILSQACEDAEDAAEAEDVELSQACQEAEEMDFDQEMVNLALHLEDMTNAATHLGITVEDISKSMEEAIDCWPMCQDGGGQVISAWSNPKKKGK